jgi:hypothetical protein
LFFTLPSFVYVNREQEGGAAVVNNDSSCRLPSLPCYWIASKAIPPAASCQVLSTPEHPPEIPSSLLKLLGRGVLRATQKSEIEMVSLFHKTGYNEGNSENGLAFTAWEGDSDEENRLSPENTLAFRCLVSYPDACYFRPGESSRNPTKSFLAGPVPGVLNARLQ